MKYLLAPIFALAWAGVTLADESAFAQETKKWQAAREAKLKADNGWLTLAGRFILKDGPNTFGTDSRHEVVFPAAKEGAKWGTIGTVIVDSKAQKVRLKLADGIAMTSDGKEFTGERELKWDNSKRDWVSLGQFSMHIIERNGKFILRLADNESTVRKNFPGCDWFAPNDACKVDAKFVPYAEEKTLNIVNVIGEISKQPCPGYAEFRLNGETHKLDAIKEGEGLFFVFRDATANDTTYSTRFIDIDKAPQPNSNFTLDFNKAYNPPCAFSEYTTCPMAPKQNVLKIKIEAGEKYRNKK